MSQAVSFPSNWNYASNQFNVGHSDALSENIAVFRPVKDSFDSRAPGTPIKIVVDSNSSFLRSQRSYLSAKITLYNQDGSLLKTATLSKVGAMALFRTASVKVGGKVVDNIEDYPSLLMDTYATSRIAEKKWLGYYEGVNRLDAFKNANGSFTVRHHPKISALMPLGGQPLPLCVLPNQSVELGFTLGTMQMAFTDAPAGSYFTVSDVRYVAQLVTPSASYLSALWNGLKSGKYLEMDLTGVTQVQNPCSGATQNNFLIPLANARVIGISSRFRDDSAYASQTGDKADIYNTANLTSWRIQLGQYRLPLTEDFKVEDTLIVRGLSMNDNTSYFSEDIDIDNFYGKNFALTYSWLSNDEDSNSALNLVGSDGNIRVITNHSTAPPTSTSLVSTIYHQKTLLIGETVDVV